MSADIRVDTPEDFRLEQTVSSRALCLKCKNIRTSICGPEGNLA